MRSSTLFSSQTSVAPLAGAWIEIRRGGVLQSLSFVAPLAGAWIEMFGLSLHEGTALRVAPLAGAWIEIQTFTEEEKARAVAPLAGAWIEIDGDCIWGNRDVCRTPRGCVD